MTVEAIERFVSEVVAGKSRAVARAMRLVDDRREPYFEVLQRLHAHTGRAWVLGVTGSPGAGKSTLVGRMVEALRERELRVAVVAVDPTSPFTGGAILGDRIRMQQHFLDEGVFIRSLATRGNLGGLSRSSGDVIRVLDAAGFDVIVVETVGVGQDELEIAQMADTTVVVVAPGLGDDVQAIKAGILEIADVFCVNKADREGAESAVMDLEQMIGMGALTRAAQRAGQHGHSAAMAILRARPEAGEGTWAPPVVKTVAADGAGVNELLERCEAHRAHLESSGQGAERRAARRARELRGVFLEALVAEAESRLDERLARAELEVRGGDDPYAKAASLIEALFEARREPAEEP
jgi:LAO/AO transport system kinase